MYVLVGVKHTYHKIHHFNHSDVHGFLVHSNPCGAITSHHHLVKDKLFSSYKTETPSPLDTDSLSLLPAAPGKPHSALCLPTPDRSGDLL